MLNNLQNLDIHVFLLNPVFFLGYMQNKIVNFFDILEDSTLSFFGCKIVTIFNFFNFCFISMYVLLIIYFYYY